MDAYLAQELEHTVPLRKNIIKKNRRLKIGLFGSMLAFSLSALLVGILFANKWGYFLSDVLLQACAILLRVNWILLSHMQEKMKSESWRRTLTQ